MARGQAHNFSAQNGEAQRVTSANMPPPRGGRASTKKLWSELPLRSGKDYPQTASDPSQPGGVLLLTRPEAHTGRSLTKFTMAKDTFTSDCAVGLRESIQTDSPHADTRESCGLSRAVAKLLRAIANRAFCLTHWGFPRSLAEQTTQNLVRTALGRGTSRAYDCS